MKLIVLCIFLFLFFTVAGAQDQEREQLVQQLQALKRNVLAEDKEAVAKFFSFPLKDENLKIQLEKKENLHLETVSRNHFIKHYKQLFTPEVVQMFRQLDFTKLIEQQELIVETPPKSKKDYCTRTYEIIFMDKKVSLSFLSNTRLDIELPEDAYCEEYAEFWQFNWVDDKLQFHSLEIAG